MTFEMVQSISFLTFLLNLIVNGRSALVIQSNHPSNLIFIYLFIYYCLYLP